MEPEAVEEPVRKLRRPRWRPSRPTRPRRRPSRPRTPASPTQTADRRRASAEEATTAEEPRIRTLTSPDAMTRTCPSPDPVAGMFVFGSISPTTEPTSPAGPPGRSPHGGRCTRRGIVDGVPDPGAGVRRRPYRQRCARQRPGRPPRRPRRRVGSRPPAATPRGGTRIPCPGKAFGAFPARRRQGCVTSVGHRPGSTRGSRRCAATTPTGSPWRRTAWNRTWPVSSPPGPGRWTSTPWLRHREICSACMTSPPSAGTGPARPPSATQRLDWSREGDLVTARVSADAFCWSMVRSLVVRCWPWGGPTRTRLVRNAVGRGGALQRLRGGTRARADADRRRLSPMISWPSGSR